MSKRLTPDSNPSHSQIPIFRVARVAFTENNDAENITLPTPQAQ
ncbi:hypothetical protein COO91_06471 [Nostoc flagelliforme CCNUN1]|uniref:Uncharacterized protein n=1 Tax=Nostoc flagelliforme CCNUN1 TaxID=2038116 RepID=A0A2K8SYD0_9NOSO|nr:hypothetical protein COO91_06471 [Nostoc flagelliforme CCNUN1]